MHTPNLLSMISLLIHRDPLYFSVVGKGCALHVPRSASLPFFLMEIMTFTNVSKTATLYVLIVPARYADLTMQSSDPVSLKLCAGPRTLTRFRAPQSVSNISM